MKNDKNRLFAHTNSPLKVSFYLLFSGWTLVIFGIVIWSYNSIISETEILARREAYKSFEKDVMFRLWAASHGGVYVPVTDSTQPNPYLKDIKERDIVTPSGKQLTLMNPAYITRQVHEISSKRLGIKQHITSLLPIRPENNPDDWEVKALKYFEKGGQEYYGLDTIDKEVYYRYMAPLITESGCLKCHAAQGYKIGDIRGGISASVNWKYYQSFIDSQTNKFYIGYGALWIIGLLGLGMVRKRFIVYLAARDKTELEMRNLNMELITSKALIEENLGKNNLLIGELTVAKEKLTELNATKDKLFSIIAHDLRAPFVGFLGQTKILAEEVDDIAPEKISDISSKIHSNANNLFKLLSNLLNWAQMQRGEIGFNQTTVSIRQLLNDNINSVAAALEQKEIKLVNNVVGEINVFADEKMVNSVIVNLLSNAIKFTRRSGEIIVDAVESGNNMIEVSVKDNGIGMNDTVVNKLFELGEKIGRKGTEGEESTGLGLLLCKDFVKRNGGEIRVVSADGKGSTFYFTLPKA